jgi:hypothetical protein
MFLVTTFTAALKTCKLPITTRSETSGVGSESEADDTGYVAVCCFVGWSIPSKCYIILYCVSKLLIFGLYDRCISNEISCSRIGSASFERRALVPRSSA